MLETEVQEATEFVQGHVSNLWWNQELSLCRYFLKVLARKWLLVFLAMCHFHTLLRFLRGIKDNNVEY